MGSGLPDAVLRLRQERMSHIEELRSVFNAAFKQGRNIYKEKLVATYCIKWGVSRRTLLEYLSLLQSVMKFGVENNIILPKKKYKDNTL